MRKIYFYKMTVDNGGAPCVQDGLLSLSICKPRIRSTCEPGDVVLGFAGKGLKASIGGTFQGDIIYVAVITRKLTDGLYYDDPQYADRADCIYTKLPNNNGYHWKPGSRFHGHGAMERDLGKAPDYKNANTLLSCDFKYFGHKALTLNSLSNTPFLGRILADLKQGERVKHGKDVYDELMLLKDEIWTSYKLSVFGNPIHSTHSAKCDDDEGACLVCHDT